MDRSHERIKKAAIGVAQAVLLSAVIGSGAAVWAADMPDKLMIEKGREVFLTAGGVGCVSCHGPYAEGTVGIGPSTRGSNEQEIRAALKAEKCMEFLHDDLSDAQIRQIAAYSQWLGQLKLIKALVYGDRFVPARLEVHPGTKVHFVVANADTQDHTFTSDGLGFDKVTIEGHEEIAVVWDAPQGEGTFSVVCADCRVKGQPLAIAVTANAPKFVPGSAATAASARTSRTAPQKVALTPAERDMVARGRDLFLNVGEVGCAGCHGRYAEGDVGIGPYNRGFSEASIRRALKAVAPMAFLDEHLGETEIKQIAAYYKSLADVQLIKSVVVRGLFVPQEVMVHPGTPVQLVITNTGHAARTFISGAMGLGQVTVPAKESVDLSWKAPDFSQTYSLECIDCPQGSQRLSIWVTDKAPLYTPPVALR